MARESKRPARGFGSTKYDRDLARVPRLRRRGPKMQPSKALVAAVTGGVAAGGIVIGAICVAVAFMNDPDAPTARIVAPIALLVGVRASARALGTPSLARLLARLDPRFDPRRWRTEHQVALMAAMALGGLVCLVFSASLVDFSKAWSPWSGWDASILTGDVILVLLWTLFGALIAGGGVHVIPNAEAIKWTLPRRGAY
jgi:hypothetical protein